MGIAGQIVLLFPSVPRLYQAPKRSLIDRSRSMRKRQIDPIGSRLLLNPARLALSLGTTDRSLARSAWENAPRKHRPVGYV
jgi:hypothetical protein